MPVDPELLPILEALNGMPRLQEVPLDFLRDGAPPLPTGASTAMARVANRKIDTPGGDLLVRIYHPKEVAPLPVLVYFHGGGWVGSLFAG